MPIKIPMMDSCSLYWSSDLLSELVWGDDALIVFGSTSGYVTTFDFHPAPPRFRFLGADVAASSAEELITRRDSDIFNVHQIAQKKEKKPSSITYQTLLRKRWDLKGIKGCIIVSTANLRFHCWEISYDRYRKLLIWIITSFKFHTYAAFGKYCSKK